MQFSLPCFFPFVLLLIHLRSLLFHCFFVNTIYLRHEGPTCKLELQQLVD